MPRKPKTISGAPGGPPREAVGVPYGEGERRMESQRRTPVPSGPPPAPGVGGGGAPSASGAPTPNPQVQMMRAIQAAQRMKAPTSLYGPTERPTEPITAGMPMGPGPGTEVIRTGDRVARTLRLIADVTGEARFEQLAEQAARQGR